MVIPCSFLFIVKVAEFIQFQWHFQFQIMNAYHFQSYKLLSYTTTASGTIYSFINKLYSKLFYVVCYETYNLKSNFVELHGVNKATFVYYDFIRLSAISPKFP